METIRFGLGYIDRATSSMYVFSEDLGNNKVMFGAYSFPEGHTFTGGIKEKGSFSKELVPANLEDLLLIRLNSPLHNALKRDQIAKML